jgi:hypothetical protein
MTWPHGNSALRCPNERIHDESPVARSGQLSVHDPTHRQPIHARCKATEKQAGFAER